MSNVALRILCWLTLLLCAPALAQDQAPAPPVSDEPYQVPEELLQQLDAPGSGAGDAEVLTLSLPEALRVAARQNLNILLQREVLSGAQAAVRLQWGRYEPTLLASYEHGDTTRAPDPTLLQQGAPLAVLRQLTDGWSVGLTQRLPVGTQLTASLSNLRLDNPRSAPLEGSLLNSAALRLQLTQPLLRGFAFSLDVPRAELLRARLGSERAREEARVTLLHTVRATEDAYWDLVQARRSLSLQRGSLELAREQHRLVQRQIAAGLQPPSDLIGAESTLAQRELALVKAESVSDQMADRLRGALGLPKDQWGRRLLPTDPPRFAERGVNPDDLDEAFAVALRQRPELAQRRLELSQAGLDLAVARADRLPQLDLGLAYGLVGQRVTFQETMAQLFAAEVPGISVSATFAWAPLMVAARAQVAVQVAAQRAARLRLAKQQQDLLGELRDAARSLRSAAREVRAAARFRALARRALDAEQRKFLAGTSNNFMVTQRLAEIAQAQLAELEALVKHQKAEVALLAAMGVLLEERGIQLDVAPRVGATG